MCGIAGYYSDKGVSKSQIEQMNDCLRHRGPDDSGVYVSPDARTGLGHRRLSIIDIDGGRQPMSNEDGSVWITFNGEIYNYRELKSELKSIHNFRTKSDTEIILHLYEEKGTECVKHLRGMFAFCIYDQRRRKLFIARDHLGQKPLYYFHRDGDFVFGSEIKALLAVKPDLNQIDREALYEYLTIRIITPPRSMFRQIRKLPPSHYLVFENNQISIERYWTLNYTPKLNYNLNELLAELEARILATVRYHLVSDVPVGAFLSGGLDSSIIVAMMRKATDSEIMTFSGDVPYEGFSEVPYAHMVARQYSTHQHDLAVKPSLSRSLPDLIWHLDEPSDPLAVCLYYLAYLASKNVKVVLGGDGGDELFGGYDRYYGNVLVDYYAMIPEAVRKAILGKIIDMMPETYWYRSYSHRLRWIHQLSFHQSASRYAKSLGYFYFSDQYKKQLYTESFQNSVSMFDPEVSIIKYYNMHNDHDIIDRMLHSDSLVRMPDHPNMILDRMTMAHGLEARSPFLDHELASFCARIPSNFKVRGTTNRYIETQLAKKYLPEPIVKKKKQGFSSALPYLLADEFKFLYRTFLSDSYLVRGGFLNQSAIDGLLSEHLTGRRDHGNRLWLLCNAEVWYRMYIENQDKELIMKHIHSKTTSMPTKSDAIP